MAVALVYASLAPLAAAAELYKAALMPQVTPAPAPRLLPRQDLDIPDACESLLDYEANCGLDTYDAFLTASPQEIVSYYACLCSPSGTAEPTVYDGLIQTCYSTLSAAEPESYSYYGFDLLPTAPCETAIDIIPIDGPDEPLPTGADDDEPPFPTDLADGDEACSVYVDLVNSCAFDSIGYLLAPLTRQARCDCYQGYTFAGAEYDAVYNSCWAFISSASPSRANAVTQAGGVLSDPCSTYASIFGVEPGDDIEDVPFRAPDAQTTEESSARRTSTVLEEESGEGSLTATSEVSQTDDGGLGPTSEAPTAGAGGAEEVSTSTSSGNGAPGLRGHNPSIFEAALLGLLAALM